MIIRSKRVFLDGKLKPAALVVVSGRISAIRSITYESRMGLDLGDLILLPGAIDAHVHFRDPEAAYKEDFGTGSSAALAGGVTSIFDMPNYRNPPTTTVGAYMEKERIASQASRCDWALHFGGTDNNSDLVRRFGPPSVKIFLSDTDSPLSVSESGLHRHFSTFAKERPVLVHCEDRKLIDERKEKYKGHGNIRNSQVALTAVKKVAMLGKRYGKRRVHFCHLTTADEVRAAKTWPGASAEVAPHHLFLSVADVERLKGWGNVNPPLRSKAEVASLWKTLKQFDCISSDHAPHTAQDKEAGASGFPGVQTTVPLLLDAVAKKRLTLSEAVRLFATGPAKTFNIANKGKIAAGFDADIIAYEPKGKWAVVQSSLHSKCGWSPYEGMELAGKIDGVILRGEQAVIENEIQVGAGFGRKLNAARAAADKAPPLF